MLNRVWSVCRGPIPVSQWRAYRATYCRDRQLRRYRQSHGLTPRPRYRMIPDDIAGYGMILDDPTAIE